MALAAALPIWMLAPVIRLLPHLADGGRPTSPRGRCQTSPGLSGPGPCRSPPMPSAGRRPPAARFQLGALAGRYSSMQWIGIAHGDVGDGRGSCQAGCRRQDRS